MIASVSVACDQHIAQIAQATYCVQLFPTILLRGCLLHSHACSCFAITASSWSRGSASNLGVLALGHQPSVPLSGTMSTVGGLEASSSITSFISAVISWRPSPRLEGAFLIRLNRLPFHGRLDFLQLVREGGVSTPSLESKTFTSSSSRGSNVVLQGGPCNYCGIIFDILPILMSDSEMVSIISSLRRHSHCAKR